MHDIFYFTDVHGQLDLFQTMRDWCYKQDPECSIIYGGDACDRGDFGYDIMEAILDDPQIVYLKGNHEDMFVKAAQAILEEIPEYANKRLTLTQAQDVLEHMVFSDHNVNLHIYNGGNPTLISWMTEGCSTDFVDKIDKLPLTFSGEVCDFSHAGGSYKAWREANNAEYEGVKPNPFAAKDMLWDRDKLALGWKENRILIHGHTPTCLLPTRIAVSEEEIRPVAWQGWTSKEYYPGWRIDMDTGMTWTGRGYVLNCLTMEVFGFWDRDVGKMTTKRPVEQFENYKII